MRYTFLLLLLSIHPVLAQQPVSLLKKQLKSATDDNKINNYLAISKAYAASQPDSAVDYCNMGIRIAEKQSNLQGQASLLLQLCSINAMHHHAELARKFNNDAMSIFTDLNNQKGTALCYRELGALEGQEQNPLAATRNFDEAIKLFKVLHDDGDLLETYRKQAEFYEGTGEADKALNSCLQGYALYKDQTKKPEGYFVLLNQIARVYLTKGDNNTALHYLQEGVRTYNASALSGSGFNLIDEEGKIFEKEGKKDSALCYYKRELVSAKESNNLEQEANALVSIAGILKEENTSQSIIDLQYALNIAKNLNQPQLESSIYKALAGNYRLEHNYKDAMAALEEHEYLLDSLMNADTAMETAAADTSYILASSKAQVGNLLHENKIENKELRLGAIILSAIIIILGLLWIYFYKIHRLNKELKTSNQVKDTLFSIIGHDLKGPAGSAAQLFELIETEEFSEIELRAMVAEIGKQTTASFELLNALFEWGKAQMLGITVKPAEFITKAVINKNIALLSRQAALKEITINDLTAPDLHVFADQNHFDFIIRNLLSNAIKFTFDRGHIEITARRETNKNEIIFAVKDSGIGISAAQQYAFLKENLAVAFGTKGEKGSGLGLLLIKEYVQENKGKLWLESIIGQGSTFFFSLPMKNRN